MPIVKIDTSVSQDFDRCKERCLNKRKRNLSIVGVEFKNYGYCYCITKFDQYDENDRIYLYYNDKLTSAEIFRFHKVQSTTRKPAEEEGKWIN